MGLFRPSREPDEKGLSTVNLRMAIFALGAVVAVVGMVTETSWLVYLAVGILAVGVVVRLAAKPKQ